MVLLQWTLNRFGDEGEKDGHIVTIIIILLVTWNVRQLILALKAQMFRESVSGYWRSTMRIYRHVVVSVLVALGVGSLALSCGNGPNDPPLDPGPNFRVSGPSWNHSGTAISYTRLLDSTLSPNPGYYLMDSDGAPLARFPVVGTFHHWFPGDTEFIYNTGGALGAELQIYNTTTRESRPTGIVTFSPPFSLSRDGNRVYYEDKSINGLWSTTIYEQRLSGGRARPIADGEAPTVSTDGRFLAYHRRRLYLYDLQSGVERELLKFGWPKGWVSPNVLLVSDRENLFVVTTSGDSHRLIDAGDQADISPINHVVVFERVRKDGLGREIWRMGIDGQGLKRLVP